MEKQLFMFIPGADISDLVFLNQAPNHSQPCISVQGKLSAVSSACIPPDPASDLATGAREKALTYASCGVLSEGGERD